MKKLIILLFTLLLAGNTFSQTKDSIIAAADAAVKAFTWDIQKEEKGSLMFLDVPYKRDNSDSTEVLTLTVAKDKTKQRPDFISVIVPSNVVHDNGIFIKFSKTIKENGEWKMKMEDGLPVRVLFEKCNDEYCTARIIGGYADLESVWTACREALTSNGLAVIQGMETAVSFEAGTDKPTWNPVLSTRLVHSSGEWVESYTPVLAKDNTAQAQGSGITYARRYALAAMVGVYQTDDDAEAAQGRKPAEQHNAEPVRDSAQVASFKKQMEEAQTKEELKAVGLAIKAFERQLPGPTKKDLQGLYSSRMEELA